MLNNNNKQQTATHTTEHNTNSQRNTKYMTQRTPIQKQGPFRR